MAFIEDYDINVCRHLIQGVDVWLNNPRRPLEASGTSGQKVVLNGGLNCSILDGWWAEAYNGVNGFAIGNGRSHVKDEITDQRDATSSYETLEKEVIPCFYSRDVDGLPKNWIKRMMHSISTLAWRFSSHRMVADYTDKSYVWAAGGVTCDLRYQQGRHQFAVTPNNGVHSVADAPNRFIHLQPSAGSGFNALGEAMPPLEGH